MTAPRPDGQLVSRDQGRLRPDASRILSRLFVPGQETLIHGDSRAMAVIDRVLAMPQDEVDQALSRAMTRFSARYRDLGETLDHNFVRVAHRLGDQARLGHSRRRLVGAYFTQEYALEAAALFNPSIVPHPDQTGCAPGDLRFIMSLRAVGEGHLSCIEFRSGTISQGSGLRLDPPGRFLDTGQRRAVIHYRDLFRSKLAEFGHDGEDARFLLSALPPRFDMAALDLALADLARQRETRGDLRELVERLRWIAESNYAIEFDEDVDLSERVLYPAGPGESHGMEDARFVRFTDGDDQVFYATYTAFDGSQVTPQLLETRDFRTFTISQLSGPAAVNKGMALFPRPIDGRFVALSRWDRENNAITYSKDGRIWGPGLTIRAPARSWELIQVGNCGSPIETPAGWLVFTHGVGPMREYAIGALLLDLDDPERLISALPEPLLAPDETERDGYVPNVLYSCGAMRFGDSVLLPYGCSDSSIRFATVDLPRLLDRLVPGT